MISRLKGMKQYSVPNMEGLQKLLSTGRFGKIARAHGKKHGEKDREKDRIFFFNRDLTLPYETGKPELLRISRGTRLLQITYGGMLTDVSKLNRDSLKDLGTYKKFIQNNDELEELLKSGQPSSAATNTPTVTMGSQTFQISKFKISKRTFRQVKGHLNLGKNKRTFTFAEFRQYDNLFPVTVTFETNDPVTIVLSPSGGMQETFELRASAGGPTDVAMITQQIERVVNFSSGEWIGGGAGAGSKLLRMGEYSFFFRTKRRLSLERKIISGKVFAANDSEPKVHANDSEPNLALHKIDRSRRFSADGIVHHSSDVRFHAGVCRKSSVCSCSTALTQTPRTHKKKTALQLAFEREDQKGAPAVLTLLLAKGARDDTLDDKATKVRHEYIRRHTSFVYAFKSGGGKFRGANALGVHGVWLANADKTCTVQDSKCPMDHVWNEECQQHDDGKKPCYPKQEHDAMLKSRVDMKNKSCCWKKRDPKHDIDPAKCVAGKTI